MGNQGVTRFETNKDYHDIMKSCWIKDMILIEGNKFLYPTSNLIFPYRYVMTLVSGLYGEKYATEFIES